MIATQWPETAQFREVQNNSDCSRNFSRLIYIRTTSPVRDQIQICLDNVHSQYIIRGRVIYYHYHYRREILYSVNLFK